MEITTASDRANGVKRLVDDDGLVTTQELVPRSQLMQDVWVLHHTGHKRGGVFVDVGAHDGVHFSNTYLLEKEYGWTGVCVEPHCESFEKLQQNRTARCLPYAAWSRSNVMVNYHRHQEPMLSGVTRHASTTMLETMSLNDICAGLGAIDYISIDTEGTEQEILSTFDWSKHAVKCWSIEHNNNHEALSYYIDLFRRHGYLWRIWHWDVLAVKDEAWARHGG